jgi:hypothetical protein
LADWREEERVDDLQFWKGSKESIAMVTGSWKDEEESGRGGGEGEEEKSEMVITDCCQGACPGVIKFLSLLSSPCSTS